MRLVIRVSPIWRIVAVIRTQTRESKFASRPFIQYYSTWVVPLTPKTRLLTVSVPMSVSNHRSLTCRFAIWLSDSHTPSTQYSNGGSYSGYSYDPSNGGYTGGQAQQQTANETNIRTEQEQYAASQNRRDEEQARLAEGGRKTLQGTALREGRAWNGKY